MKLKISGKSMANNKVSKDLKHLMKSYILHEDMEPHVSELVGDSDRAIAIVGGAIVESALKGALLERMPNLSKKLHDDIFDSRGALSTFSSKINIAAALEIISLATKRNANYIRAIRNIFAHSVQPISFGTPKIRAMCELLKHSSDLNLSSASTKELFIFGALSTGKAIHKLSPLPECEE